MLRVCRTLAVCLALLGLLAVVFTTGASAQDSATPVVPENQDSSFTTNDVETATVTLGVTMQDDGPIPAGMTWTLFADGWVVQATGTVPAGGTSWSTDVLEVPYGSYGYWITGTYYSSGQSLPVGAPTVAHTFDFQRAAGPLSFVLDTSDGNDVPADSIWSLLDSSSNPVEFGVLTAAIVDGGSITTVNSFDYGNYTLQIDADGYDAFSQPVTIDANPTSFTANLVSSTPLYSTVSLTLTTSDATSIPAGTTWSFAGQSGTIATTTDSGLVIDLEPVLYGTHTLSVATPGNAFTYTDSNVVIDATTRDLTVIITRYYSAVTLKLTTSDNSDIPAGTQWGLVGTDKSGTIDTAMTTGLVIDLGSVEFGQYGLVVRTPLDIFYYNAVVAITQDPQELVVDITDASAPEDHTAAVDLTIHVNDATNIPAGTTWALTLADDGYTPVASGAVPPASASPYNVAVADALPWGQYVFFVYSPELIYYQAYVVNIAQDTFSYDILFEHRQGDLTATVSTSDDGDIPVGTTWSITDADNTEIQAGTITGATGSPLDLTNPVDYGTYTLTMTDPTGAYLPFVEGFAVYQPVTSLNFTLTTVPPVAGDVELTVTTSNGEPVPTGTIITIGGVTMLVTGDGVTVADIASGTVVSFSGVPEGEQGILVTNATPYEDYAGTVEIVAGETIDAAIELRLAQAPPVLTPTPTPNDGDTGTVIPGKPGVEPTAPATTPAGETGTDVTTLPSTGQHQAGTSDAPWLVLGLVTLLALVTLGAACRVQRR
jgi:hypothetical protein